MNVATVYSTKYELTRTVRFGIQKLDAEFPDRSWRGQIELADLDLENGNKCVLGQIYGGYDQGLEKLGLTDLQAAHYGFAVLGANSDVETGEYAKDTQDADNYYRHKQVYRELNELWELALAE